jgi:hypothetical protein
VVIVIYIMESIYAHHLNALLKQINMKVLFVMKLLAPLIMIASLEFVINFAQTSWSLIVLVVLAQAIVVVLAQAIIVVLVPVQTKTQPHK